MKDFLVSIVIPAYRTEKHVRECIQSALSQNYPNTEILLVDDGSPDGCPEIFDEYAMKHDNIRAFHQKNQGIGIARDTGLLAAKGDYVFFMDSDDYLDGRDAIGCLVNRAKETQADIVVGNYRKLQGGQLLDVNMHHLHDGEYTKTANFRFEGFYRYGHLAYNWGKLYRRAFLLENDLLVRAYPFTQDKAHNMLCYAYSPRYAFVDESVYVYRMNEESVSFRYKENLMPVWISIATDFHDDLKKRGMEDRFGDITAFHIFFGSFFIVKQELSIGKGIRKTAQVIRKYGEDPFVAEAMKKLAKGEYLKDIASLSWKVVIRGAAMLFHAHGYFLFTLGISALRGLRIDGIITDKRNKRKKSTIGIRRGEADQKKEQSLREDVKGLCLCLKAALTCRDLEEEELNYLKSVDMSAMIDLAQRHRVAPMIYDLLAANEEICSREVLRMTEKAAEKTVRQSYRLLFLTRNLVNAMERENIPVVVLKGCSVASYYPIPEYRKSGDVDLLFPNMEAVHAAGKILEGLHYSMTEEQHANHHVVYQGADGIDVELHAMLAEPFDDGRINQKMQELLPRYFEGRNKTEVIGISVPTAADELQALELLLHMLQHFLRSGFGLKLLTDWVVFWNRIRDERTAETFRELARDCGVSGFAKAITLVCEKYLGLQEGVVYGDDLSASFSKGYARQFLMDVIEAEEFGKADKNRMVALRKRGAFAYAKEFHYQMRMNYAAESKQIWKWPYLWVKTFVVFLRNNKKLGRGSLCSILKSAGERAGVVEEMHLFSKKSRHDGGN